MKTAKNFLSLLKSMLVLSLLVVCEGCEPEPVSLRYDINNLYGKWRSGTEYYVYQADGMGYTWDEKDDVSEDEAQPFEWTVDNEEMIHIHKAELDFDATMYYIITELTSSTLKYYDAYNKNDTYSFIKVN